MSEKYTKKELRKYLSSALKELGAYGFGISFEIYDAKLSDPEYSTGGKYGNGYTWDPDFKDNQLKKYSYGDGWKSCTSFSDKKRIMKYMVEGVILEIQSYDDVDGVGDYFYIELPTKSNPNKKLIKYRE